MRALFVSPHPDDAELGCGGLIHRLLREGASVTVAVCTGEGDLKMAHSGESVPFLRRRREQVRALSELGDIDLVWLNLAPASQFDRVPQATFVLAFDGLFRHFDQTFLPLPSYNSDHERVWRAGLAAFRPGKLSGTSLLAYEQPIQGHGEQATAGISGKCYYTLTTDDLAAKKRAILEHGSQVAGREDTLYGPAGIEALAKIRGLECGACYAELVYPLLEIR
jgi:LmbE family N-acetylglucosaminyl deacetylase